MIQQSSTTTLLARTEFTTLLAQSQASTGSWQTLSSTAPILPINAALLYTGKVLFFAGSSNNPTNINEPNGSAIWDVSSGTFTKRPAIPTDDGGTIIDIFCVGQSFLANGCLLIAGGTKTYDTYSPTGKFIGREDALIFDPDSEEWTRVCSMQDGRWYPTLITLGDGRVLAVSGANGTDGKFNKVPEIYDPVTDSWTPFPQTTGFPEYLHLFLLSDGRVFFSGGYMGDNDDSNVPPSTLTLPTDPRQSIQVASVNTLEKANFGNQAASVLLPPVQNQKVMIIGGGDGSGAATNRVNIIDLTISNPTYTPTNYLQIARMHCNAVLLPDRTVFVCGGSKQNEDGSQAALTAEIYDPATGNWTTVAAQQYVRLYHSVALLLPDGRVLSGGGNPERRNNCNNNVDPKTGFPCEELHLEIYSPPYISSSTRPQIISADSSVTYGDTISIQTAQSVNIKWISLIKPMATTHSYDSEQRVVDCPFYGNDTNFTATVTSNPNIAPPGWYMLFITDQNRIPSTATWIQLIAS